MIIECEKVIIYLSKLFYYHNFNENVIVLGKLYDQKSIWDENKLNKIPRKDLKEIL